MTYQFSRAQPLLSYRIHYSTYGVPRHSIVFYFPTHGQCRIFFLVKRAIPIDFVYNHSQVVQSLACNETIELLVRIFPLFSLRNLSPLFRECRAYFRKLKRPGIGHFFKNCPFLKIYFLNFNCKYEKQLLVMGKIRFPPTPLHNPTALMSNKGTFY